MEIITIIIGSRLLEDERIEEEVVLLVCAVRVWNGLITTSSNDLVK